MPYKTMKAAFLGSMEILYPRRFIGHKGLPAEQLDGLVKAFTMGWRESMSTHNASIADHAKWVTDYQEFADPNWKADDSWKWWLTDRN